MVMLQYLIIALVFRKDYRKTSFINMFFKVITGAVVLRA